MRLVDADKQLEWVDCMTPIHGIGLEPVVAVETVRDLIKGAPTIGAIPVEWLEYMQQESLSENDRTMVGAIEAIFIEWHIYVNRLREMNRQKEQEAQCENNT